MEIQFKAVRHFLADHLVWTNFDTHKAQFFHIYV